MPAGVELPPETGGTFYKNARIKARGLRDYLLSQGPGPLPGESPEPAPEPWTLADDSGLEVAALGGAPGVYSARYAGEGATDRDNVARLLAALAEATDRRARFVCEIVCLLPGGREIRARGTCAGEITTAPRGGGGFGYDPVFVPEGHVLTFSQLPAEEKNRISHRARAAHSLLQQLGGGESR